MFNVGDLVKVTCASYYIDGIDDKEWFGKTEVGNIGLIITIDPSPEQTIYLVSIVEEDGVIEEYFYYEHELELIQ